MSNIVANKYVIMEQIGKGMFGEVYLGKHKKTSESVAIKIEKESSPYKLLKHETTILKYLYDNGSRKIPLVYWFGIWNKNICFVMSFYECSLHDYCKTSLMDEKLDRIMIQCLNILESIHTHYVIHRDIKPQNFMILKGEIYIIDFGLATFFVDDKIEHIENPTTKSGNLVGSPKYASYNIHNGDASSRRDDLISLGYMYIYLYAKELPWDICRKFANETLPETSIYHEANELRKECKSWENLEPILVKINQKIYKFLNYCYQLKFNQTPNYHGLTQLFYTAAP
jgi:serine/threonine protein kinase